ncbi:MAG: PstS family phosphate ABC transporter substrate-binding protein [Planctomycetota bacterium]
MIKSMLRILAVVATAGLVSTSVLGQTQVDPNLPSYKPVQGVSGSINSVGSDTMNNMMALWTEKFKEYYPDVTVSIEGKGSGTAPPALIEGTSNFGPMSRAIKETEIDKFEEAFGYEPTELRTAIDMLAVYVHKDNPIADRGLTLPEVDAIFSKTRNLGYANDVRRWGQVGLTGAYRFAPISVYGRNSASGTYGYFKGNAMGKGDFKDTVNEQPGSSAVVQSVASDRYGIGYSGIGYKTADVKVVPLAAENGGDFIPAEGKYAYSGEYPLARFLYLSVNYRPGSEMEPLRREFIKFIFSKEGQEIVLKDGYLPVSNEIAKEELDRLGISR